MLRTFLVLAALLLSSSAFAQTAAVPSKLSQAHKDCLALAEPMFLTLQNAYQKRTSLKEFREACDRPGPYKDVETAKSWTRGNVPHYREKWSELLDLYSNKALPRQYEAIAEYRAKGDTEALNKQEQILAEVRGKMSDLQRAIAMVDQYFGSAAK